MWRETYCAKQLLHYMREHTYRDLPPELFDRYLWLYAEVEEFQRQVVYGATQKLDLRLYEAVEDDRITAIATVLPENGTLKIKFDAPQGWALDQFLSDTLAQHKGMPVSLTVSNLESANQAARLLNSALIPGKVKYYTDHDISLSELPIKEMGLDDEYPSQWRYYKQFLAMGQRIFGLFLDKTVRAMCGLVQLTCLQAQIISVETFDEADRQRGFAKAVCALALREGLKDAPVVTWSTSLENTASCRTAEALGMKPYYGLYEIHGKI